MNEHQMLLANARWLADEEGQKKVEACSRLVEALRARYQEPIHVLEIKNEPPAAGYWISEDTVLLLPKVSEC